MGGRYQVPVYKGSVPKEIFTCLNNINVVKDEYPRTIMKKMVSCGRLL